MKTILCVLGLVTALAVGGTQAARCEGGMKMDGVYEVKAYGAKADGKTDDTAAIQKACDAASKQGGIVSIPPGKYLVAGSIKVAPGVHVRGAQLAPQWQVKADRIDPQVRDPLVGSIILATGGRDKEDGPSLFELGRSCSVSGLSIYYPEQKVNDIHPYSWTFHLQSYDNTVENITLINSYNGIMVGPTPNGRHRIRSVYGTVLRRGIMVDWSVDCGRIENVHFHGMWWGSEGLGADVKAVTEYVKNNLEAFVFARSDGQYVNNTFVYGAKTGYRFVAGSQGACMGQFDGITADAAQRGVVVEAVQSTGISITNGLFFTFVGNNPIDVEVQSCEPAPYRPSDGSVRFVNCAFWGSVQKVVSHGENYLSLSDCWFSNGRQIGTDKPAVEVYGGRFKLRGCSFAWPVSKTAVALRKGVKHAIITENDGAFGVSIINEIGDKAIIANNEPPKEKDPGE